MSSTSRLRRNTGSRSRAGPRSSRRLAPFSTTAGRPNIYWGSYQIRINGDEAEATTKVRVIHIGAGERARLTPYESIGVYEDLLRRTPEGWRIVHRRFDVQISIGDIAIPGLNLS